MLAVACLLSLSATAANAQSQSTATQADNVPLPPATSTVIVYYGSRKATLEFTDGKLTQWNGDRSDETLDSNDK